MKKEKVDNSQCSNDKREEEVKGKKAGEGCFVYGEPSSESLDYCCPYVWNSGD